MMYGPLNAIPPYSESLKKELERRRARMRLKLARRYGLADDALENPEIAPSFTDEQKNVVHKRLHECVNASHLVLSAEKEQALFDVCIEYAGKYDYLLTMRKRIFQEAVNKEKVTETDDIITPVIDAHASLVTLEALMNVKAFGLDEMQSLFLVGAAVKLAVAVHEKEPSPVIRPAAPVPITSANGPVWLESVLNNAQNNTDLLCRLYESDKLQKQPNYRWYGRASKNNEVER